MTARTRCRGQQRDDTRRAQRSSQGKHEEQRAMNALAGWGKRHRTGREPPAAMPKPPNRRQPPGAALRRL